MVNVMHSARGRAEAPLPHPQIRRFVAVDETVAASCRRAGVPAERLRVILNAVDMDRFRPRDALPARPRRALLLTKNHDHQAAVRAACRKAGLTLDALGPGTPRVSHQLERELPRYDIVFATARMALEAAAVGCAVVVADGRGFAGLLTSTRLDTWRPLNFGAALLTTPPTEDLFLAAIAAYDPVDTDRVTTRIRHEAGLEAAVAAYVGVYREAIAEDPLSPRASALALAALLDETQVNSAARSAGGHGQESDFDTVAGDGRAAILQSLHRRLSEDATMRPEARAWLIAAARDSLSAMLARNVEQQLQAFDDTAAELLRDA